MELLQAQNPVSIVSEILIGENKAIIEIFIAY